LSLGPSARDLSQCVRLTDFLGDRQGAFLTKDCQLPLPIGNCQLPIDL